MASAPSMGASFGARGSLSRSFRCFVALAGAAAARGDAAATTDVMGRLAFRACGAMTRGDTFCSAALRESG